MFFIFSRKKKIDSQIDPSSISASPTIVQNFCFGLAIANPVITRLNGQVNLCSSLQIFLNEIYRAVPYFIFANKIKKVFLDKSFLSRRIAYSAPKACPLLSINFNFSLFKIYKTSIKHY